MAVAGANITVTMGRGLYGGDICYKVDSEKKSNLSEEQEKLASLSFSDAAPDVLKKHLDEMHDIDLKFCCNNRPFIYYLIKLGKYDALNIILDKISTNYKVDCLDKLEANHFDISNVYQLILESPDCHLAPERHETICHLVEIGVDIVKCGSNLDSPLGLLLSKNFDNAFILREVVVTQVSLTNPNLHSILIGSEPLVIHIAKNIDHFSTSVIRQLVRSSADFSHTVNDESFTTILCKLLKDKRITEAEVDSYLEAAGLITADTDEDSWSVLPIDSSKSHKHDHKHHKFKMAKKFLKDLRHKTHKDRLDAINRLALDPHQSITMSLSNVGSKRTRMGRRSSSTEDLPLGDHSVNSGKTSKTQTVWSPFVTKKPSISYHYRVKHVVGRAIHQFHKAQHAEFSDQLSLMSNREAIALADVYEYEEALRKEIHTFYPVYEATDKQKQKLCKKLTSNEQTKAGRKVFKDRNAAISMKYGGKSVSTTKVPAQSVGCTDTDSVYSDTSTFDQHQSLYRYAERVSISSCSSEPLIPAASISDVDSEAFDPQRLQAFIPVLSGEEPEKHCVHVQKYTAKEIVDSWQNATKKVETLTNRWKEINRELIGNIAKNHWDLAISKVSERLRSGERTRESISEKVAQFDADLSEKLAQIKADDHLSHGQAATLHGIETFGNLLPLVQLFKNLDVFDWSEVLETSSATASTVLSSTSSAAKTTSHLMTDWKPVLDTVSGASDAVRGLQEGIAKIIGLLKSLNDSHILNKVERGDFDFEQAEAYFEGGERFATMLIEAAKSLTDCAGAVCDLLQKNATVLDKVTPALGLCLYSLDLAKRTLKLAHDINDYCKTSEIKLRLKEGLPDFPILTLLVDSNNKTNEQNLIAVVFNDDSLGECWTTYQQDYAERYFAVREIKAANGKRIRRQLFELAMDLLVISAEVVILTGVLSPVALVFAGTAVAAKSAALGYRTAKQEYHDFKDDSKSKENKHRERAKVVQVLIEQLKIVVQAICAAPDSDMCLAQLVELDICFSAVGMPLVEFIETVLKTDKKDPGNGIVVAAKELYAKFNERE